LPEGSEPFEQKKRQIF